MYQERLCYILIVTMMLFNSVRTFMVHGGGLRVRNIAGSIRRPLSGSKDFADLNSEVLGERDGAPVISWYPGHIAKAERELSDYLKKVDVVIEVRDARIPFSTTHPKVKEWVGKRPLIVAVSRLDQISSPAQKAWKEYYAMNNSEEGAPKVYFIDGKKGSGVMTLRKQILKAGVIHNERRMRRGIAPRATRCAIIGYPNVGKSALINKILGKKMAKSRNMPGVTRSLMWVRIGGLSGDQSDAIELLDSPGIIPAQAFNQEAALKLAICNDIGQASYDRVLAAGAMMDLLNGLHYARGGDYVQMHKIQDRYGLRLDEMTGEEAVFEVAESMYGGNMISAADKLLGDFRKGFFGTTSLEAPPIVQRRTKKKADTTEGEADSSSFDTVLDVGKGNYDGW